MTARSERVFICQPRQIKLPATLDVFTYGNTGYLAIRSDDHKAHVALAGNAAALVIELRQAADALERKLFLSDHRQTVIRAASARSWDWLTPEMVIKYFEQSPALRSCVEDVRAVLKPLMASTGHYVGTTQAATPTAPSQLELDLEAVRPHLGRIISNGKVNKSEIGRILKIKPSGPIAWARLTEIAEIISSSSFAGAPRPGEIGPVDLSAAA